MTGAKREGAIAIVLVWVLTSSEGTGGGDGIEGMEVQPPSSRAKIIGEERIQIRLLPNTQLFPDV